MNNNCYKDTADKTWHQWKTMRNNNEGNIVVGYMVGRFTTS